MIHQRHTIHQHPDRASLYAYLLPLLIAIPAFHHSTMADPSPQNSVTLTTRVDRSTVPIDETAKYIVTVAWDGAADRYRFGWPQAPKAYHLSIVGSKRSSRSWVDSTGQHSEQEFTYLLEPEETGTASLGAVLLTYWDAADTAADSDGHTLTSAPISITIVPSRKHSFGGSWQDTGITVVVLAGVLLSVLWVRRRRKQRERASDEPATAEPDELDLLIAELPELRKQDDIPGFYAKALAIIRTAFVRDTGDTTIAHAGPDEISERLDTTSWPDDVKTGLRSLLAKIDRRRFAPSHPEAWELQETERLIERLHAQVKPTSDGTSASDSTTEST